VGVDLGAVLLLNPPRPSNQVSGSLTRRLGRKPDPQLEVLDPVVLLVSIQVMDRLVTSQESAKVLGHHEAMLRNVALAVGHRMPALYHADVALMVDHLVSIGLESARRRIE
jgi:hypothetical protein